MCAIFMLDYNHRQYRANNSGKRYIIHQGGTGSGKTYSVLQYLLSYAMLNQGVIISVVAKTMPHLMRGAIRDTRRILSANGWLNTIEENKTTCCLYIGASVIEFFPADDEAKLRGARRDILFINECNTIDYECFQQLDVRTRKRTILDFNPVRRFWVHSKLIPSLHENDFLFLQSTYLDNQYLGPEEITNIERRRNNANWWKVYGEGEIGITEGVIFNNWQIVTAPSKHPPLGETSSTHTHSFPNGEGRDGALPGVLLGYGIDFGFIHSPTAIVQVNEYEGELYVHELFYKKGVYNEDILAFAQKNLDMRAPAVADSNEPKTISYLNYKGWYGLKPAVKGPDSILHGINMLLERKINVTAQSLNLIKELSEYMWDNNMAGEFIRRPVKDQDHAIDALRYIYSYPKKRPLLFT